MPNWVPQSPTWFWRITSSPRNSSTRPTASPMMVERRWPTCISLARFGEDRSTTTRCCAPALRTPRCASARAASRRWARASVFWKKFRKPGPAMSTLLMDGSAGRAAISFSARSRGFMPAGLASIMAMLLAKSPWLLSLVFSTWIAGVRPAGSTPSAVRRSRACWIRWRMLSFIGGLGRRGCSKTAHYRSSGKGQATGGSQQSCGRGFSRDRRQATPKHCG